MIRFIGIEWRKIWHRRLNWITLGVLSAVMVIVYLLLWAASGAVEEAAPGQDSGLLALRSSLFLEETVPFAITMLFAFGVMAAIVVVGANAGSEYGWNTIRTMTAATERRSTWLAAKVVALAVAIVAMMLVALVVAVITSAVITAIDGELTFDFVTLEFARDSLFSFLRMLLAFTPYVALTLLAATFGRSTTAAISIGVGIAFLEGIISGLMTLAGGWVEGVPKYLLDRNYDTLMFETGSEFGPAAQDGPFAQVVEYPSPEWAAAVLVFWALLFGAAAFLGLERQELTYQA